MDEINIIFSKQLIKLRKKKQLTQEKLAYLSGIDYKHLQRLESKNPPIPRLDTLKKLTKGLNVSLSKLLENI